jgi:hypothetical protein
MDKKAQTLFQEFIRADQLGIRLEMVGGLPIWEAQPVLRHQRAVDRIRDSIKPTSSAGIGFGGVHVAGVYIQFLDGSLKRPDVSIFCKEPEEQDEAVTLVPEAVIEVISRGYEAKDLDIGPGFYLSQGVKDVVIFNPHTLVVLHIRKDEVARHVSPVALNLSCGCSCEV